MRRFGLQAAKTSPIIANSQVPYAAGDGMNHSLIATLVVAGLSFCSLAQAGIVAGGGSKTTDCMTVFDVPGANKPAPPKAPKLVDCVDGDIACDADGERNGECVFELSLCVNDTTAARCTPVEVAGVVVDHAEDDGDPRFDVD